MTVQGVVHRAAGESGFQATGELLEALVPPEKRLAQTTSVSEDWRGCRWWRAIPTHPRGGVVSVVALLLLGFLAGCSGEPAPASVTPVVSNRSVMWLGSGDLDADWSGRLAAAGVDELAVRVGAVTLGGGAPVVRLASYPRVAGTIPVAVVLRINRAEAGQKPATARALWGAVKSALDGNLAPAEVLLDLPTVPPDFSPFVAALSRTAGVRVVPVVTVAQLQSQSVLEVIRSAGSAVVLAYGSLADVRPEATPSMLPLSTQLAPLTGLGATVRVGVVLEPRTIPPIGNWGDDLNALCNSQSVRISTDSELDRTFSFTRALSWSGVEWKPGSSVAVRWTDAARLDAALREITNLTVPDVSGWDLISLPPPGNRLGMGREALLAYLSGEGPAPRPEVRVERSGRSMRVVLSNPTRFSSAVSTYATWTEVGVEQGSLVAEDRGDFDRVMVGTLRRGDWQPVSGGGADAVRFYESYLAPGEEVVSGVVRLPSPASRVVVRWSVTLTTGEVLTGVAKQ
ncbi:MAG: hypothetical protein LJE95_05525 [Acidobacteria bacterium]|nr:hypothetical protein [Acidobacteriota bacterium]